MTTDNLPGESKTAKKKKTLLEKYEMPLSHLDFEYINKCCNILEIERIVRILRSGEEGNYPELLECAEKRLKLLCPEHKILQVSEPIMTKSHLNPEEWDSVHKEIMEWKQEINDTDQILNKSKNISDSSNLYPDVRRPVKKCEKETKEAIEKKKVSSTDYNQWEKFDADKECLKLDLEEEKRAEEKQRRELAEIKKLEAERNLSLEEKEIEAIAPTVGSLSLEERKMMAIKEKELGNEFYKRNLFNDALKYYTRSIYLHSSAVGYNNRAATYLKQCRFTKALDDLNIVLDLEPDNVKGHFRRALTLQHKNEFQKALDDILFVLKHEPNHVIAKHIANELRENCCKLPKTHKLRTFDEKDPKKIVYTEVTDEEFQEKYKDKKDFVEVNDFNIPKVMCNCSGKHTNDPLLSCNDPIRYQSIRARYGEKAYDKIAEMESKMLRAAGNRSNAHAKNLVSEPIHKSKSLVQSAEVCENMPSVGGAKRIDIVELEKIEEEEMTSKIQGTHLNVMGDNRSKPHMPKVVTSCVVTDRRKIKTHKVYFGNYEDNDEGKLDEAAAAIPTFDESDIMPISKEEKMSLNTNLKESLDMGGSGDAAVMGIESMVVDESSPPCSMVTFDNSPPQPLPCISLSSSSAVLHKGSVNYESSSSEAVTDDELTNEITVDIHQVEVPSHSNIDSLAKLLFPGDTLKKCECGEGFILWPSQFETKWLLLEKSLEERSKLIRLVCPHLLPAVIPYTLNVDILSGFIDCLLQYFDPVAEEEKVRSYLLSIANLPRFHIIYYFLTEKSKLNVSLLLKKLSSIPPELEAFK